MIRVILALMLCVSLSVAAHAREPRIELAADSAEQWVAFDLTPGNQIRFAMTLDDEPVTAILDSGVSASVASLALARRADLDIAAGTSADAIGGEITIGWTTAGRLRLGGLTRRDGRIAVAKLSGMATGSARGVDLLIGSDILSCCALDIDYDRRRFRLLPSGHMPFAGTSVPLAVTRDTHLPVSELRIGTVRIRPVLVDTGDGASITVARAMWDRTRPAPDARMTTTVAFGLGGAIETRLTVLPEIGLAGLSARDVEVRIEPERGFSDETGTAGRIGSAFLQRYRVLLDPRAGHMVLAPGSRADQPPVRSTSGLLVGLDRDRLRVLHVMRNSPAARAGWRDGDLICRVDGRPVALGADKGMDTSWSAGPPGDVVILGMCDGTRRTLTLASFY
ncbi:aspartyl protease family protein [Stakelama saccharophila]|uniref:Aspartyl protease family protein n=1 Tax=Stakelama saccharophila TaxID=3075605 RepID=A0ABZ0B7U5_9SPHN|nr:aspartyl protease family protein [Stakelama sp. W311]WNO53359.1 aspartyl protease family protein [Stakelama sp. W311]